MTLSIRVAAGEKYILVGDMVLQMCDSWDHVGPELLGLGRLSKSYRNPGEKYGLTDSLSQADLILLANIWTAAGLSPVIFGMPLADWDAFDRAFRAAPGKPAWHLNAHVFPVGRKSEALPQLLRILGDDEQLVAFSAPDHMSLKRTDSNSFLRVQDARRWLARWGFELAEPTAATDGAPLPGRVAHEGSEALSAQADKRWTPERRADLLTRFRRLGGKRSTEKGSKGKRGALAKLARETSRDKDTLGQQLDKAISEKKSADMWAQLNPAE